MMDARRSLAVIVSLAAFVLVSSYLGLSGRALDRVGEGLGFMGSVWAASLVADVVFSLGSAGAAFIGFSLARRAALGAILVSGALNWLVYWVSFLLLPGTIAGDVRAPRAFEALQFVGSWGLPGLLFAALAPSFAALWWKTRDRASAPIATDT